MKANIYIGKISSNTSVCVAAHSFSQAIDEMTRLAKIYYSDGVREVELLAHGVHVQHGDRVYGFRTFRDDSLQVVLAKSIQEAFSRYYKETPTVESDNLTMFKFISGIDWMPKAMDSDPSVSEQPSLHSASIRQFEKRPGEVVGFLKEIANDLEREQGIRYKITYETPVRIQYTPMGDAIHVLEVNEIIETDTKHVMTNGYVGWVFEKNGLTYSVSVADFLFPNENIEVIQGKPDAIRTEAFSSVDERSGVYGVDTSKMDEASIEVLKAEDSRDIRTRKTMSDSFPDELRWPFPTRSEMLSIEKMDVFCVNKINQDISNGDKVFCNAIFGRSTKPSVIALVSPSGGIFSIGANGAVVPCEDEDVIRAVTDHLNPPIEDVSSGI